MDQHQRIRCLDFLDMVDRPVSILLYYYYYSYYDDDDDDDDDDVDLDVDM